MIELLTVEQGKTDLDVQMNQSKLTLRIMTSKSVVKTLREPFFF